MTIFSKITFLIFAASVTIIILITTRIHHAAMLIIHAGFMMTISFIHGGLAIVTVIPGMGTIPAIGHVTDSILDFTMTRYFGGTFKEFFSFRLVSVANDLSKKYGHERGSV